MVRSQPGNELDSLRKDIETAFARIKRLDCGKIDALVAEKLMDEKIEELNLSKAPKQRPITSFTTPDP